jgi:two-component system sensor histidine kinase AgrC
MIYGALLVVIGYNLYFMLYFQSFSPKTKKTLLITLLALVLFGVIYAFVDKSIPFLTLFLVVGVTTLTYLLVTNMGFEQSLFCALLCIILANSMRNIVHPIITIISYSNPINLSNDELYHMVTLIAFPLAVGSFHMMKRFIIPGRKLQLFLAKKPSLKLAVSYLLITSLGLVILNSVARSIQNSFIPLEISVPYSVLMTGVLNLLMLYLVIYYMIENDERQQVMYQHNILMAKYEQQILHYNKLHEFYEEYRKFKHDYKHITRTLRVLIKEKEYEETRNVLEEMDELIQTSIKVPKRYSNNVVLDSMMNELNDECEKHKINLSFEGVLELDTSLTVVEKIMLFHNLASNAIEACLRVDDNKRFILLKVQLIEGWVTIVVENSFNGEAVIKNDKLMSTKEDTLSHGYGLTNLDELCRRHGGLIRTRPNEKEKIFITVVMLPRTHKV